MTDKEKERRKEKEKIVFIMYNVFACLRKEKTSKLIIILISLVMVLHNIICKTQKK